MKEVKIGRQLDGWPGRRGLRGSEVRGARLRRWTKSRCRCTYDARD
jgi:hypothetical protein